MPIDLTSPNIPTMDSQGQPEEMYDANTVALRDMMNAVYVYQPTFPPAFPAYIRAQDTGIGDEHYNVGFHHVPVPSGITPLIVRYESPDVPVTHLPFAEALFNTTLVQKTVGNKVVYRMRAPGINEGY